MDSVGGINNNASCASIISAADAYGTALSPLMPTLTAPIPQPCVTMSLDYAACVQTAENKYLIEGSPPTSVGEPPAGQTSCFCGLATMRNNELEQCYTWLASWMTDA